MAQVAARADGREPAGAEAGDDGGSHALPVLALVAVTVISLWPAVEHFRTKALADRLDATVFTWAWWAMPRALLRGENPFDTDLMFHPVGTDLALTTTTPLVSLLTWPIRAALGPEAQINSVQLAAGFLAGLGAYLLAHRAVGSRGPALFAGVAFTLTTSRFVHVPGHFNLIHTGVLPFGALLLLRFTDAPSLRRALALGAFTGATFLIDPQLTLLVLVLFVPLAVVHRSALRGQLRHLAAGVALAGVVALPLLGPMAQAMSADEMNPAPPVEVSVRYSASPLAWVMPPSDHVLGDLAGERSPSRDREGEVYPGLLVVALAVAGIGLMARERRRGWPAVALVGVVLSFGPRLIAYDTTIDVPMPYALLRALPGLDLQRVPGRFALVGVLGLVVLGAGALAEMARRGRERGSLLVGAAVVLTALDLLVTGLPQRDGTIPEPFQAIADDAGDGAVLELPVQWYTGDGVVGIDDRADFSFLLHATVHGRPIVSGGVSRYPDRRLDALRSEPLYQQVLALQGADGFDAPARFDREDLVAAGIGYVAYDRDRPLPEAFAYFDGLDLPVLADDGTVIVWSTGAG